MPSSKPTRSVVIRFRATEKEARRLTRLATHYSTTPSGILRRLIAEAHAHLRAVTGKPSTQPTQGE